MLPWCLRRKHSGEEEEWVPHLSPPPTQKAGLGAIQVAFGF